MIKALFSPLSRLLKSFRDRGNPVVCELRGGLGNQLSSYFSGLYVAQELSRNVIFDLSGANSDLRHSISRFGIKSIGVPWKDRHLPLRIVHIALRHLRKKVAWDMSEAVLTFRKLFFGDHKLTGDSRSSAILSGEAMDPIRRLAGFFEDCSYLSRLPAPPASYLKIEEGTSSVWLSQHLEKVRQEKPVALHFRRNDYRKIEAALLPMAYYVAAVNHHLEHDPHSRFWVFSDELSSTQDDLSRYFPAVDFFFVESSDEVPAAEVLTLLAATQSIVAANSTFSWWAIHLSASDRVHFRPPLDVPLNPFRQCQHASAVTNISSF